MKRIAFVVALLFAAGAGLAAPRTVEEPARPAAESTTPTQEAPPADLAAPAGSGPQKKWALPELPPPVATELRVGTSRRPGRLAGAPAPVAAAAKPGVSSPRAKRPTPAPMPTPTPAETDTRNLLASMTAQSLVFGEARVTVAEGERVLRPGDLLGADTVRSVAEGVIVFDRPAVAGQPGGPATVVVRFEANGRARVRVLYEQDPTPVQAPRMK